MGLAGSARRPADRNLVLWLRDAIKRLLAGKNEFWNLNFCGYVQLGVKKGFKGLGGGHGILLDIFRIHLGPQSRSIYSQCDFPCLHSIARSQVRGRDQQNALNQTLRNEIWEMRMSEHRNSSPTGVKSMRAAPEINYMVQMKGWVIWGGWCVLTSLPTSTNTCQRSCAVWCCRRCCTGRQSTAAWWGSFCAANSTDWPTSWAARRVYGGSAANRTASTRPNSSWPRSASAQWSSPSRTCQSPLSVGSGSSASRSSSRCSPARHCASCDASSSPSVALPRTDSAMRWRGGVRRAI